jgi:hypothetical protein
MHRQGTKRHSMILKIFSQVSQRHRRSWHGHPSYKAQDQVDPEASEISLACFLAATMPSQKTQGSVELLGGLLLFSRLDRRRPVRTAWSRYAVPTELWESAAGRAERQCQRLAVLGSQVCRSLAVLSISMAPSAIQWWGTVSIPTFLVQISSPTKLPPFAARKVGYARESQHARSGAVTVPLRQRRLIHAGFFCFQAPPPDPTGDIASFVAVRVLQTDSVHTHLRGASQISRRSGLALSFISNLAYLGRCRFAGASLRRVPKIAATFEGDTTP